MEFLTGLTICFLIAICRYLDNLKSSRYCNRIKKAITISCYRPSLHGIKYFKNHGSHVPPLHGSDVSFHQIIPAIAWEVVKHTMLTSLFRLETIHGTCLDTHK